MKNRYPLLAALGLGSAVAAACGSSDDGDLFKEGSGGRGGSSQGGSSQLDGSVTGGTSAGGTTFGGTGGMAAGGFGGTAGVGGSGFGGTGGSGFGGSGGVGGTGFGGSGGVGGTGFGGSGGVGGSGFGGTGFGGSGGVGGGANDGKILCEGGQVCSLGNQFCCLGIGPISTGCKGHGDLCTPGTEIYCDGPEDCPGQVCCGFQVRLGGSSVYSEIRCADSCQFASDPPQVTLCGNNPAACPLATPNCGPSMILPPGFMVCRP